MIRRSVVVLAVSMFVGGVAEDALAGAKMVRATPVTTKQVAAQSDRKQSTDLEVGRWQGSRAIVRDVQSGKLRKPTALEAAKLVRSLKQLTRQGLRAVQSTSSTSRMAEVEGTNVVIARETADGTVETLCVTTFEEAAAFLGLNEQ